METGKHIFKGKERMFLQGVNREKIERYGGNREIYVAREYAKGAKLNCEDHMERS